MPSSLPAPSTDVARASSASVPASLRLKRRALWAAPRERAAAGPAGSNPQPGIVCDASSVEAQAASACRAERESWDYEAGKDLTRSPRLPPTGRGLVLRLLSWTSTTASLNYSMLQLLWVHVRTNYVSNEAENAKGVGTHWRANAHAERTQKQTTECTGRDFFVLSFLPNATKKKWSWFSN